MIREDTKGTGLLKYGIPLAIGLGIASAISGGNDENVKAVTPMEEPSGVQQDEHRDVEEEIAHVEEPSWVQQDKHVDLEEIVHQAMRREIQRILPKNLDVQKNEIQMS